MDKIIILAGTLGIGYFIFSKEPVTEKIIEEKKIETVEPTIESTKIGLLPAEDKKALLMNLKNAKSYSSTFAIVTAVVGGVFTSFYISKKMFIVVTEYLKGNSVYGLTEYSLREIFASGINAYLDTQQRIYNRKIDPLSLPANKEIKGNRPLKDIMTISEEKEELDDPMLSQGPPPLPFYGKGVTFIKPEVENTLIENKEPETMQNAQINEIDNIPVIVKKTAQEFNIPLPIEQDVKIYKYDEIKEGEITIEEQEITEQDVKNYRALRFYFHRYNIYNGLIQQYNNTTYFSINVFGDRYKPILNQYNEFASELKKFMTEYRLSQTLSSGKKDNKDGLYEIDSTIRNLPLEYYIELLKKSGVDIKKMNEFVEKNKEKMLQTIEWTLFVEANFLKNTEFGKGDEYEVINKVHVKLPFRTQEERIKDFINSQYRTRFIDPNFY